MVLTLKMILLNPLILHTHSLPNLLITATYPSSDNDVTTYPVLTEGRVHQQIHIPECPAEVW